MLAVETHQSIDLTSENQVLTYTSTSTKEIIVSSRVDLGVTVSGVLNPIQGGGIYHLNTYINDTLIAPDSLVTVRVNLHKASMQSRAVILNDGDTITIKIIGLQFDSAVSVFAQLMDITPVTDDRITSVVEDAVQNMNITVSPERVILGKCDRRVHQLYYNKQPDKCHPLYE